MSGEETVASKLTDIAEELSGLLADANTELAGKSVSPASVLLDVPDQIHAIETGTGITPTGTKSITSNGTHDVTTYANANVNVPTGTPKTASDITVSGKTVTVPAGLYSSSTSKSVATATHPDPTINVNTSTGKVTASHTQSTGYVTGDTTSKEQYLDTQGAQTITPGTANQTIPSGKYLTGAQTILGDANLVSENIKAGVSIFGKQGNYVGGGGAGTNMAQQLTVSRIAGGTNTLTVSLSNADTSKLIGVMVMYRSSTVYASHNNPTILSAIALKGSSGNNAVFTRFGQDPISAAQIGGSITFSSSAVDISIPSGYGEWNYSVSDYIAYPIYNN